MERLIILDYTTCNVDVYDVDSDADIDEEYISNIGYNTDNCYWMFWEEMEVTFHKEILR